MKKALLAASVISLFASTQAHAGAFGFTGSTGGPFGNMFVAQGYQGFDYTGNFNGGTNESWVNDTTDSIDSSYGVGAAPLGAAWSNGGAELILTSANGGLFNFGSVSLDVGYTESVTLDGFKNGQLVDAWTGQIANQSGYTNVLLNWTNVDKVTFSQGANLFVTNINAQHVPEPASLALFGAGLLGLAMLRKKSNQA